MGQYLKQRDNRSELQQRLDAELRAKAAERKQADTERPDGVSDSEYIKHTKQTTGLDWAWLLIAIGSVLVLGYFIYMLGSS
jgi:hypothetical protein